MSTQRSPSWATRRGAGGETGELGAGRAVEVEPGSPERGLESRRVAFQNAKVSIR